MKKVISFVYIHVCTPNSSTCIAVHVYMCISFLYIHAVDIGLHSSMLKIWPAGKTCTQYTRNIFNSTCSMYIHTQIPSTKSLEREGGKEGGRELLSHRVFANSI